MSHSEEQRVIDLYIGPHCGLCDQAIAVMTIIKDEFGIPFRTTNIYEDDRLLEQYQLMIPVAAYNGYTLKYGQIYYTEMIEHLAEMHLIKKD